MLLDMYEFPACVFQMLVVLLELRFVLTTWIVRYASQY
jgi:hypothetical protein